MSRLLQFFNTLVFWQTTADAAHFRASSVGQAQPTLAVRCPPAAHSLAVLRGCKCFEIEWSFATSCCWSAKFGLHTAFTINIGTTTEALVYCLYGSRKFIEFLAASLLSRRSLIQPVFALAAWGRYSPRWRCVVGPLRAL